MILAQIHNLSEYIEDGTGPRNENEIDELIHNNQFEEILERWDAEVRKVARESNIEIAQKLKGIRQTMYSTDAKKTMRLITKDQTPQCEVEHELLKNFFNDRWKRGEPIDENLAESIYKLDRRER
jgi:hypothetical protein